MFGFEIGDTVVYSERGLKSFRQHHKTGEVVGFRNPDRGNEDTMEGVRVLWECNLTPIYIHHSFIKKI